MKRLIALLVSGTAAMGIAVIPSGAAAPPSVKVTLSGPFGTFAETPNLYKLVVKNNGGFANNTRIKLRLPEGSDVSQISHGGSRSGDVVKWNPVDLSHGERVVRKAKVESHRAGFRSYRAKADPANGGADSDRETTPVRLFASVNTNARPTGDQLTGGDPDAIGEAYLFVQAKAKLVCPNLDFDNLEEPDSIEIRKGRLGQDGPLVLQFDEIGCVDWPAKGRKILGRIMSRPSDFYVLVKTPAFADGAVRGQLGWYLFASMNGANVPGGDPDGSGVFSPMTVSSAPRRGRFELNFSNIAVPISGGHIHKGVEGQSGPIVVDFGIENFISTPIYGEGPDPGYRGLGLNPTKYYLDIHNDEFPDGAIRGQLNDNIE